MKFSFKRFFALAKRYATENLRLNSLYACAGLFLMPIAYIGLDYNASLLIPAIYVILFLPVAEACFIEYKKPNNRTNMILLPATTFEKYLCSILVQGILLPFGCAAIFPLGDTLALIAATTWAFYSLFMKRVMGRYSSDFITRKIFFYGVLTILPYFAIVQPLDTDTSLLFKPHIIGNLIFLGVIASSLAYLMWSWALREIGTVKASNLIYTQTLVTMILGSIVLGERITLMAVSGVIILFTGVILAVRTPKEKISVKQ